MDDEDLDLLRPLAPAHQDIVARALPAEPLAGRLEVLVHELRSPLAVIQMAAATVGSGTLSAAQQTDLLAVIERQATTALALIGRLSHDDPGQSRQIPARRVEFDLAEATRELLIDLRPSLGTDHPIALHAPRAVTVRADRLSVAEITTNLLTNAAAHTPADTAIEVTVDGQGQDAVLEVLDHGPGIASHEHERVFARHVTLGSAATGHGLGLFIARQLAEDNGGELTVHDDRGGGARFVLRLPRDT
ncbi:MAG: HAMP domain-containing histidine kinase [Nitriliruptoraceae bacterium]|nr:HAMP domain-containing histidine kinase [Nitriliruptoraceae bacterium]